jgi:hypothetical protein
MAGAVGLAIHEDRLATAARNLRLAEAERTARARQAIASRPCREVMAGLLMALALRLAPSTTGTVASAR